jgi:1-phosphofructokinase
MAVAYGSAAAALPGSALPTPAQLELNAVQVTPIAPISPTTNTKVSP